MHVAKFAHGFLVFHFWECAVETSLDVMFYMRGTFRYLVGRAVTRTHHNALGATSATGLRFELFWQVVVVFSIKDLIKGAFC